MFDNHFKPFGAATLTSDFSLITQEGELDAASEDIFEFDAEFSKRFLDALPIFVLAAKLATAVILSGRWLCKAFETTIRDIHGDEQNVVETCTSADISRLQALIRGGFRVHIDTEVNKHSYGSFNRIAAPSTGPREVDLSPEFVQQIQNCGASAMFINPESSRRWRQRCWHVNAAATRCISWCDRCFFKFVSATASFVQRLDASGSPIITPKRLWWMG